MKKLLIATRIPAKFNEYRELLKDFPLELLSLQDVNMEPVEESSDTIEQVAIQKAKYYYQKIKMPTLVDAGGIEIDALDREPGVKSYRWLGHEMTDEEIISEIMKRMSHVPKDKRTCNLLAVIALATPFGIFTAHGDLQGTIAEKASHKRIKDHPYNSVIYLPNYGKYMSEMDEKEKDIVSPRRAAIEKLHDILRELEK